MIQFVKYLGSLIIASFVVLVPSAHANILTDGLFEAQVACAANRKLRSDNPGQIALEKGEIYEIISVNKNPATHVLIVMPDAPQTKKRWVSVACGDAVFDDDNIILAEGEAAIEFVPASTLNLANPERIENLLAASWLPTFCLSQAGEEATECQRINADDIYAKQFSIHGLWPNDLDDKDLYPCYCHLEKPLACNVRQPAFASIEISNDLRTELKTKMPGIQSGFLHRHEWTKHGTCYEKFNKGAGAEQGADAEEYYRDTIHILDQLNASDVGKLFEMNIGKHISDKAIYAAFNRAFGDGASDRVFIDCKRYGATTYISELFIGLGDEITPTSQLAELIKSSPTRFDYSDKTSCKGGVITQVR